MCFTAKQSVSESARLAQCVGDSRDLLRKILVDSHRQVASLQSPTIVVDAQANHVDHVNGMLAANAQSPSQLDNMPTERQFALMSQTIVDGFHKTFVSAFHAFYPSRHLKWNCLCDLLNILEPVSMVTQCCTIISLNDVVSF